MGEALKIYGIYINFNGISFIILYGYIWPNRSNVLYEYTILNNDKQAGAIAPSNPIH